MTFAPPLLLIVALALFVLVLAGRMAWTDALLAFLVILGVLWILGALL